MNLHFPQTYEAAVEMRMLASVKNNIISPQESKPNLCIVQDSLLASHLMTKLNAPKMTRDEFYDMSLTCTLVDDSPVWTQDKINTIRQVRKKFNKKGSIWDGHGLVSLLLPDDFCYTKKNKGNPQEPIVKIYQGVFYEGTLNKGILGSSHNSLIQVLNKEYNADIALRFADNIQFITNAWLAKYGFSIGLKDCMITSKESINMIQDTLTECYAKAQGIESSTRNPGIREVRVTATLSQAKDIGMKIAKEAMEKSNNFLDTVNSGSKGDFFNIAQLTGLLGQQNIANQRIKPLLNHGRRTLPHYPLGGKIDKKREYESRGFITSSFIKGLNPREFYFHAMAGREGICDTAQKTADSGYIQRKIGKMCENIQIHHDGTVRDMTGKIYQFSYGENNLDPAKTIKVGENQEICNVSRLVARLSCKIEEEEKEKRTLGEGEIEELISFIQPNPEIPPKTAEKIVQVNKESLRKQLEKEEIFPCIIPELKRELQRLYIESLIHAGECVGIITSQSIGEKQTQANLNSFHTAGSSDNTANKVVSHFSELLDATALEKAKRVSNFVYFKNNNSTVTELRESVGSSMKELTLDTISNSIDICVENREEKENKENKENKEEIWYSIYETLYNNNFRQYSNYLNVDVDTEILYRYKITLKEITERIEEEFEDVYCVFSPDNIGKIHIYVDTSSINLPESPVSFITEENMVPIYLEDVVLPKIKTVMIAGIEGIKEIYFNRDRSTEGETWMMETEGSNFRAILSHPAVDSTRTISSNVWDIYNVLGIEAAREFMIEQFLGIMPGINMCHIMLLVDRMTFKGTISSMTRYTMRKEECGPLLKASFEETLDNLLKAGIYGQTEKTDGVSSSIICGKRPKMGTGLSRLKMNLDMKKTERKEEKKEEKEVEKIEEKEFEYDSYSECESCSDPSDEEDEEDDEENEEEKKRRKKEKEKLPKPKRIIQRRKRGKLRPKRG